MKKDQVQIGGTYVAKVSGQLARVRIDAECRFGGWDATNVTTRRKVRIKSAARLRRAVSAEKVGGSSAAPAEKVAESSATPDEVVESIARDDGPGFDPSHCATTRCKGTPVMTHLGRPLCQACWDRHCGEEQPSNVSETAGDACRPSEEQETLEEENAMSKKKTTKKQSKVRPVAAKAKAKTKAADKSAKPKVAGTKSKKASGEKKPKRVSALDAAAQVLKSAGKPMRAQELITAMAEQNLWKSPGGKTPHATLYAAMLREARDKGKAARFTKVDRGQFAFNKESK